MGGLAAIVSHSMFPTAVMGMYAFTAMMGLVVALLGGANSDYFKNTFLAVGAVIFIQGLFGVIIVWQKWWFKLLILNVANLIATTCLVIASIMIIMMAFDIRDPVGAGVEASWDGDTGLHSVLLTQEYCHWHAASIDDITQRGVHAVTETSACRAFYAWAGKATTRLEGRCEWLEEHNERCPPYRCPQTVVELSMNCENIVKAYVEPSHNISFICDTSGISESQSPHTWLKECKACSKGCMQAITEDYQEDLKVVPWMLFMLIFAVFIVLLYNVYLLDAKQDIDTWYAYMDMEAETRGDESFGGERPTFEDTTIQKVGMVLNLIVVGMGSAFLIAGIVVAVVANSFFISIAISMMVIGVFFMTLGMLVWFGIKKNLVVVMRLCNGLLFFTCFLTVCVAVFTMVATGSVSDLHGRIDDDFLAIRADAEALDPKYCMDRFPDRPGVEAPMSDDDCKQKLIDDAQASVGAMAWLTGFLVSAMILLIFCTHELMYLLYADPTGVPDTAVAAMIKAKTTHVRRLPMEELQMLARWLDANKGKSKSSNGIKKVKTKTLVKEVIGSMLDTDDHDPVDDEAKEFLDDGDQAVQDNDALKAGACYTQGLALEPGNPKLKQRVEACRRYLVQRQEVQKLDAKIESMKLTKQKTMDGYVSPDDDDFFEANKKTKKGNKIERQNSKKQSKDLSLDQE